MLTCPRVALAPRRALGATLRGVGRIDASCASISCRLKDNAVINAFSPVSAARCASTNSKAAVFSSPDGNADVEVCSEKTRPTELQQSAAEDDKDSVEIPPEVLDLFGILRGEALKRLEEFGPIHLFSLCWAYSTARLLDRDLEVRITNAALALGSKRDQIATKGNLNAKDSEDAVPEFNEIGDAMANPVESAPGSDEPCVLAEGEHWLALYKPPHWQVNVDSKEAAKTAERAAAAAPFEDDDADLDDAEEQKPGFYSGNLKLHIWIKQQLASRYPIFSDSLEAFGLLHRLDAQTSGILLCAKSYMGAYWLRLQWCTYSVEKEYVTLVHGWVDRDLTEIHKRIRVEKKKANKSRRTVSTICSVSDSGKPSFTEIRTLSHLIRPALGRPERYSLVAVKLHTGRTHQIRVHMQSVGHPLVCDSKYATDQLAADQEWCPRNFLHTYHLGFNEVPDKPLQTNEGTNDSDGFGGDAVDLRCPLPIDLRNTLAKLSPVDERSAGPYADWASGDSDRLRIFEEW